MKNRSLLSELGKMRHLAGIIKEEAHLQAGVGLLLKLDDKTKSQLSNMKIPQDPKCKIWSWRGIMNFCFKENRMIKLPSDALHVTLTSIKNFKPYEPNFVGFVPKTPIPEIKLGEAQFVYREESGKTTYVVSVENQEELKNFVDSIYGELGLQNPEPDRFYHITIANNKGGISYNSIGNVTRADFAQ